MDDVTVNQGAASTVIDLAPVFDDLDIPRGDQFTYTVAVSPPIRPIVEEVIESSYMDIHQDLLYTHLGDNRGYDSVQHDLARDNIYNYFETVKVRESSGGNDRAEQTLPLDFLLEFDAGWGV